MARKHNDVHFAVAYDDGRELTMTVDRHSLERGDHVVRTIARERQAKGELPAGNITNVRRLAASAR
jgi:hypothetical protein